MINTGYRISIAQPIYAKKPGILMPSSYAIALIMKFGALPI